MLLLLKTVSPYRDGWVGQCYGPHYIFALHELTKLKETPHDPERWNVTQPTDDPNWLENSSADVGWPSSSLHVFLCHFSGKRLP